ncbi:MAG: hypothetical protein VB050_16670 [Geobacteraceae bacterium]|nr:hypothetical protein [Geobacteraceae bacterium]
MTKLLDFKKFALVLAVIATFFVSYAVIACDQLDLDCPSAGDCPVSAAYQELSSGDSFVHTIDLAPPSILITILIPAAVSGPHHTNHVAQRCCRAPPSSAFI